MSDGLDYRCNVSYRGNMGDELNMGQRLRHLRVRAGLSLQELGRMAGLADGHVWMLENGKRENPKTKTLRQLGSVLGSSLDWLLDGNGEEPSQEAIDSAVAIARERFAKAAPASDPGTAPTSAG